MPFPFPSWGCTDGCSSEAPNLNNGGTLETPLAVLLSLRASCASHERVALPTFELWLVSAACAGECNSVVEPRRMVVDSKTARSRAITARARRIRFLRVSLPARPVSHRHSLALGSPFNSAIKLSLAIRLSVSICTISALPVHVTDRDLQWFLERAATCSSVSPIAGPSVAWMCEQDRALWVRYLPRSDRRAGAADVGSVSRASGRRLTRKPPRAEGANAPPPRVTAPLVPGARWADGCRAGASDVATFPGEPLPTSLLSAGPVTAPFLACAPVPCATPHFVARIHSCISSTRLHGVDA
eukprot:scaffold236_cov419-Prasinococcus_capsulatus_cf.AAC.35